MDLIASYHALTSLIEAEVGSDKLTHIHAGLAIYVGAQCWLRDRRASRTALQITVTLAVLNEALDRLFWGSWRLHDTLGDLAATIFWPAVLFGLGRWRRLRWQDRQLTPARSTRVRTRRGPVRAT